MYYRKSNGEIVLADDDLLAAELFLSQHECCECHNDGSNEDDWMLWWCHICDRPICSDCGNEIDMEDWGEHFLCPSCWRNSQDRIIGHNCRNCRRPIYCLDDDAWLPKCRRCGKHLCKECAYTLHSIRTQLCESCTRRSILWIKEGF